MSNAQENGSSGGKSPLMLIIAVLLGVLVGGAGGAFLGGSLLAKDAPAAKPASEDAEHGEDAEHEAEAGGDSSHGASASGSVPKALYVMDNLVLNPAQSGGSRFLMVTVAFDLADDAVKSEMQGRDAEVRDAVLAVLGSKTVMELADVAGRDSLKAEVKTNVTQLFRKGAVRQIFFPQFVIQ